MREAYETSFSFSGKNDITAPRWDHSFKQLAEECALSEYINIPYHDGDGKSSELWTHVVDLCDRE